MNNEAAASLTLVPLNSENIERFSPGLPVHACIVPAQERQSQEDGEFHASLRFLARHYNKTKAKWEWAKLNRTFSKLLDH